MPPFYPYPPGHPQFEPHPSEIRLVFVVGGQPYDVIADGIDPDGSWGWGARYVVLGYSRIEDLQAFGDIANVRVSVQPVFPALSFAIHPYSPHTRTWDLVGVFDLVGQYEERVKAREIQIAELIRHRDQELKGTWRPG